MAFEIKPVDGESYEGRQWGYMIERDGHPVWHLTTGGTGDCWNIRDTNPVWVDGEPVDQEELHVCNLDEFIAALEVLRDSETHREHVARWSFP